MNQNLRCDWLHERVRWSYLTRSGLTAVSRKKNFSERPYNNSLIDQACSALFCSFFCEFVAVEYPHNWSITHTCSARLGNGDVFSFFQFWRKILMQMDNCISEKSKRRTFTFKKVEITEKADARAQL